MSRAFDDAALDVLDRLALELQAAAALVGARERTRAGAEEAGDALVLNVQEAHGFALLLEGLADQLNRASLEVRQILFP
jgi:hypothetical protein